MSKIKSKGSKKPELDTLTKVKDAAVVKHSQTPKAKSKELAKKVIANEQRKSKKVKEPTPESSEDEEDEDEESASEEGSSDESESDSEAEAPAKPQPKKANGAVKAAPVEESESSESSESSDDEAPFKGVKGDSDEESEEEDESEESEDEEEQTNKKGPVDAPALKNKLGAIAGEKEEASDDSDEDSDSDSDSDSGSDDSGESDKEESEDEPQPKKRKAEEASPALAKKTKVEAVNGDSEASKNLFVGNLSWNVDEEWLTREFEEFGELTGVRVVYDKQTGRSRGFGYVEFVDSDSGVKAYNAKKGTDIDGRPVNIDYSKPRTEGAQGGDFKDRARDRAKSFGDSTSPPSSTLFLGNLSWNATEDGVQEIFSEYGTIHGIRLPTDQETGQLKGFGYVEFSSVDEAREALAKLNGTQIAGRPVRLDFSAPRQNSGDSPRGGRGGRGGFRGGRGGGGFGDRGGRGGFGGRGAPRGGRGGGRGGSTNRGGMGDFQGKKMTF